MARFDSDYLDEACECVKGHTNWAYFSTLDEDMQKKVLKDECVVVFFDEPADEDGEYENPFPISEEEK
jgi:hypothetical protein